MNPNFASHRRDPRAVGTSWEPVRLATQPGCACRPALVLILATFLGCPGLLPAQEYVHTAYENYWFTNTPTGQFTNFFGPGLTNAGTAVYGGHVLGNTNNVRPTGGRFGLEWSSLGHPVQGIQSDVALGGIIVPPPDADTNRPPANFVAVSWGENPAAYYQSTNPLGGAFWVPSSGQIIAAQPNNITIDWWTTSNTVKRQVLNVNAIPPKRPARFFWTESPYDAPKINMQGLFPVIHYNTLVPPPLVTVVTNSTTDPPTYTTNIVSGVWLDDQKQLRAKNVTGLFIIEYYEEGSYKKAVQPDGIEIVQVLEPDLQLVKASVGARLLPTDTYWADLDGINGLLPNVTRGLNDTAYLYSQTGPKDNWVFAINRTWWQPWALEIYWQHMGRMGVVWPYEKDWYSCDWPPHPQRLIVGDAPPYDTAPVLLPAGLTAEVMPDMEPQLQASLSASGRSFSTTQPGTCLLKYTTADNIWFEVVRTVSHTNEAIFDLEPVPWPIGEELTPGDPEAHALRFDGSGDYVQTGTSALNRRREWTLALWFNAAKINSGVLYSEGDPLGTLSVEFTASGQLHVSTFSEELYKQGFNAWCNAVTPNAPVRSNVWHHLAVTYRDGGPTNGTMTIHLDDYSWTTNNVHWISASGDPVTVIGAKISNAEQGPTVFYQGKLNLVRLWNLALSAEQIHTNRYVVWPETRANLIANLPFHEGQGNVIHDLAGDFDGTIYGNPVWGYGQHIPLAAWTGFPGYIHAGDRCNIHRYDYPTEAAPDAASYVFGVNTGDLEVWWANRSRHLDMPAVYYPSRVVRYTNVWPENPPQIVIASGLGNSGLSLAPAGDALSFDGTPANYAVVPHHDQLNVSELTVEAWVKVPDPGREQRILHRNGQVYLDVVGENLRAQIGLVDGTYTRTTTNFMVPNNQWFHIALVDKPSSQFAIYANGQVVFSMGHATNGIKQVISDLYFGRDAAGGLNTLGSIGEVRFWNRARTAAEISAAWRSPLQGNEPGLVAYYPFVRGDDPFVLTDAGSSGLDGIIIGADWTWTSADKPVFAAPSIYYQNDPALPGYNPNEEHALILDGVAYALRNDLNRSDTSEPFALVDYLDPESARPRMLAFQVVATNALYRFERNLVAGLPIEPIMPLGAMPLCTKTRSDSEPPLPPAWRDRKYGWWAISAGDDGGMADALMHFYYQMQPTFYFPDLLPEKQPMVGTELPWLPESPSDGGTVGTPVAFAYHVSWPEELPELKLGQTLTLATHGLPEVWNQLSVDVPYDQSKRVTQLESVTLFDPLKARGVNLERGVIDGLLQSRLARQDLTSPLIRFPDLPPSLYPRLYYDPNRGSAGKLGQLVLEGQRIETLTGTGYLLLNLLEGFERAATRDLAKPLEETLKDRWDAAVNQLPGELTLINPNSPYVKAALGARLTNGVGYVTLAFNNSTNVFQVPPALPISLSVIKVVPELYSGELEVILPDDALAEQLSLRYSADLAGMVEEAEFQWRWAAPAGGLIPNTNFGTWTVYGADGAIGTNEVSLSGASLFTMSDHYFAVRYRPTGTNSPAGDNWSDWTYNLAPGWVKRAMTGINPFEQIFQDQVSYGVDTRVTMISQAGGPYEGDVALNLNAASNAGLIATYQTIFNRAKAFSLEVGLSDPNMNQTLLFAASRLRDLYMLLGNEAYADAQDPTIAFPTSLSADQHGADATSIFPFMNQVPNLLEEELALLRGRDDTLEPSVHTSPIYNRLIWNYTSGINGGEPAYAYNYNIRGNPSSTVGTITVDDAKRFYPQGHGDAWGHYLSAIGFYYELLSYELLGDPLFRWQTEPEATLLGNAAVSTDYRDEQKFAETAAARARTGLEIVKQTFRQRYSEDPTGRWPGYSDSNTDRAWGIGDWASRAGQAAYYDWAVANSLMLERLTNMVQVGGADLPPEGIQKIDRVSTPELSELVVHLHDIQTVIDSANAGLNPLGLARNVVPFDIDPAAIDAGQTHFEQVYDRALQALYNACVAFDHARGATLQLNEQFDSTYDLAEALAANETDYHNRLIQIYGYPYPDDMGPGRTYPQGYDGPDLINWQLIDLENLLANAPTGQVMTNTVYQLKFEVENAWTGKTYEDYEDLPHEVIADTNRLGTISVCMADNGLKVKDSSWTGRRRAQGELQLAMADYIQAWYALESKMADYDKTIAELETDIAHRLAEYERYPDEWAQHETNTARRIQTARQLANWKMAREGMELAAASIKEGGELIADLLPHVHTGSMSFILGPGMSVAVDTSPAARFAVAATYYASMFAGAGLGMAAEDRQAQQEKWNAELEALLKGNEYKELLQWNTAGTAVKLRDQFVKQAELFAQVEALSQSYERIQKLLSEGQRLIFERGQVRARAAQRIQIARYADLGFRIFRHDALRRYQAAFDLAARYTYLAAKAYDYETGLLYSDTTQTAGSRYLEKVVRARLPGRFYVWLGTPMAGAPEGEPGLADIMARMKADWDVVKGRFGFNNPDTETSRFSLRTELWRISPSAADGDNTWPAKLEECKVANLHDLPEFIRYCRPYAATTNVEPGLVIPFSTFVIAGQNYFGHDLAGGDNAYDASHAATKVRSAGVWFKDYNTTFNTEATGPGLGNEPRVYLVPIGEDVMRTPRATPNRCATGRSSIRPSRSPTTSAPPTLITPTGSR
jgi:hypothetical protein